MQVERTKYIIWAADMNRALSFYQQALGATITRKSEVISELEIAGGIIGVHSGGEGKRTWTGLSFQVADVVAGAQEIIDAGGALSRVRDLIVRALVLEGRFALQDLADDRDVLAGPRQRLAVGNPVPSLGDLRPR